MLSVSIHYFVENIRVEVGRLCCTRLNIYIYMRTQACIRIQYPTQSLQTTIKVHVGRSAGFAVI